MKKMIISFTGVLALTSGCGTLDRAYNKQVTWTNAPVVQVVTNTITATNFVPQIVERTVLNGEVIERLLIRDPRYAPPHMQCAILPLPPKRA